MAYSLVYLPPVMGYLRGFPGLSRTARIKMFVGISDLRSITDADRAALRIAGTDEFEFSMLFVDDQTGQWHRLRLLVNDADAVHGVLTLLYAELASWAPPN